MDGEGLSETGGGQRSVENPLYVNVGEGRKNLRDGRYFNFNVGSEVTENRSRGGSNEDRSSSPSVATSPSPGSFKESLADIPADESVRSEAPWRAQQKSAIKVRADAISPPAVFEHLVHIEDLYSNENNFVLPKASVDPTVQEMFKVVDRNIGAIGAKERLPRVPRPPPASAKPSLLVDVDLAGKRQLSRRNGGFQGATFYVNCSDTDFKSTSDNENRVGGGGGDGNFRPKGFEVSDVDYRIPRPAVLNYKPTDVPTTMVNVSAKVKGNVPASTVGGYLKKEDPQVRLRLQQETPSFPDEVILLPKKKQDVIFSTDSPNTTAGIPTASVSPDVGSATTLGNAFSEPVPPPRRRRTIASPISSLKDMMTVEQRSEVSTAKLLNGGGNEVQEEFAQRAGDRQSDSSVQSILQELDDVLDEHDQPSTFTVVEEEDLKGIAVTKLEEVPKENVNREDVKPDGETAGGDRKKTVKEIARMLSENNAKVMGVYSRDVRRPKPSPDSVSPPPSGVDDDSKISPRAVPEEVGVGVVEEGAEGVRMPAPLKRQHVIGVNMFGPSDTVSIADLIAQKRQKTRPAPPPPFSKPSLINIPSEGQTTSSTEGCSVPQKIGPPNAVFAGSEKAKDSVPVELSPEEPSDESAAWVLLSKTQELPASPVVQSNLRRPTASEGEPTSPSADTKRLSDFSPIDPFEKKFESPPASKEEVKSPKGKKIHRIIDSGYVNAKPKRPTGDDLAVETKLMVHGHHPAVRTVSLAREKHEDLRSGLHKFPVYENISDIANDASVNGPAWKETGEQLREDYSEDGSLPSSKNSTIRSNGAKSDREEARLSRPRALLPRAQGSGSQNKEERRVPNLDPEVVAPSSSTSTSKQQLHIQGGLASSADDNVPGSEIATIITDAKKTKKDVSANAAKVKPKAASRVTKAGEESRRSESENTAEVVVPVCAQVVTSNGEKILENGRQRPEEKGKSREAKRDDASGKGEKKPSKRKEKVMKEGGQKVGAEANSEKSGDVKKTDAKEEGLSRRKPQTEQRLEGRTIQKDEVKWRNLGRANSEEVAERPPKSPAKVQRRATEIMKPSRADVKLRVPPSATPKTDTGKRREEKQRDEGTAKDAVASSTSADISQSVQRKSPKGPEVGSAKDGSTIRTGSRVRSISEGFSSRRTTAANESTEKASIASLEAKSTHQLKDSDRGFRPQPLPRLRPPSGADQISEEQSSVDRAVHMRRIRQSKSPSSLQRISERSETQFMSIPQRDGTPRQPPVPPPRPSLCKQAATESMINLPTRSDFYDEWVMRL